MLVRRTATALIGFSVAGLVATVLAIPAHANTDITVTEAGWGGVPAVFPSTINVTAVTATRITITVNGIQISGSYPTITVKPFSDDPTSLLMGALSNPNRDPGNQDCNQNANCQFPSNGSLTLDVGSNPVDASDSPVPFPFNVELETNAGGDLTFGGSSTAFTVTYGTAPVPDPGGGGDDGSGSGAVISGPGPHIQQFPLPVTGTCDEAQPEGLIWGGVASGGWNESWSWWMNDGEGGHVCTRTLIYNTSTATWEVD